MTNLEYSLGSNEETEGKIIGSENPLNERINEYLADLKKSGKALNMNNVY